MSIKNWPGGYIKPIPPTPTGSYETDFAHGRCIIPHRRCLLTNGCRIHPHIIGDNAMIEQLISRVFYARNLAHFEHWHVSDADEEFGHGSYAKHVALGSFYDDVIEALLSLKEANLNNVFKKLDKKEDKNGG